MKYILIILSLFGTLNLYAQESTVSITDKYPIFIGFDIGFNKATGNDGNNKLPNEFYGGELDYYFKKNHSIKIKVRSINFEKITDTWDWESDYSTASYNAAFIVIPILYKWQFGKRKSNAKAYVQGGVFFAFESKSEYKNYPADYEIKNNDYGIDLGCGTSFPIVGNLFVYTELDFYKGFVGKVPKGEYEPPLSLTKALTNVIFSFGFKYKIR